MQTKFILLRHGPPIISKGAIYGESDVSISPFLLTDLPKGIRNGDLKDSIWISSPLSRARATALRIRDLLKYETELLLDPRLKEQHYGELEGVDSLGLDLSFANRRSYWHFPADYTPVGGESFCQVYERAESFIRDSLIAYSDKTISIFTHGGFIRAVLTHVLRLDIEQASVFDISPLSETIIQYKKNNWYIQCVGGK